MGFRFHKSISILPGVRINLSKSGPSLSVGKPGSTVNIGGKGIRTTVGAPGTGMSYTTQKSWGAAGKSLGGSKAEKSTRPDGKTAAKTKVAKSAPEVTFDKGEPLNPSYFERLNIPDDEEALIDGCRALSSGDEAEATVQFRKALQLPDGAFMAGVLALKQRQFGEAVNFLSYSLERQAELGQRFARHHIAAQIDFPVTEGITATITPSANGALLALSEAYQHLNQPLEAAECLRRLLASAGRDLVQRVALAELLVVSWPSEPGACNETLSLSEGVTNETELHAALLLYRGLALRGLGMLDGAKSAFTDALSKTKDRSQPLLLTLRYQRALTLEAMGKKKEARADLEKVYGADPDFEDVKARLGAA
jgi:tetratricopeptide (TPR) repeat protein